MNTLKTVYGKLFKEETTNLATHEVELANINELKKLTDLAQKDLENWAKYSKEVKAFAKLVAEYGDNFREKTNQINSLGETLKKQFAELGMNYLDSPDVIKAVALLKKDFEVRSFTDSARQLTK
jgi:phenylalanyl-tRNA synthetase alpha subunit